MMSVVDFGGKLRIVQNFTANADALNAAVSGVKYSAVDSNPSDATNSLGPVTVASAGPSSLRRGGGEFGAPKELVGGARPPKKLRHVGGGKSLASFFGGGGSEPREQ